MAHARPWLLPVLIAIVACNEPEGGPDGPARQGDAAGSIAGLALMPALLGLWSGPATSTPLGDLPLMNMDFRGAEGRVLFARADLDAENNLRLALAIEAHGGRDVLTFRNGGFFQGLVRDSRAALLEEGPAGHRFCSVDRGCDYLDARLSLLAPDRLVLDVKVRGRPHLIWRAQRIEERPHPGPFPMDERALVGDAPFPPLPRLRVAVSFAAPLQADADLWLFLSTADCSLASCRVSRAISAAVPVGATSGSVALEQLHGGPYRMNVILDRDRSLRGGAFSPNRGDGVSLPNQPVEVAPGENSASARIVYDWP